MNFKELFTFLKNLEKNNNKEWFDAHKKEYDALRKQWLEFVGEAIKNMGKVDTDLLELEPKNCIFRINRDVRFSANKDPYKNNFSMILQKGGKKSESGGYYLHIQPGGCFIAGGAWQPMPDKLAAIRQEIDYHASDFVKIVTDKNFVKHFGKLGGEVLQRPPKGYEADNPMIQFIKHKSFIAECKMSDKEVMDPDFIKVMTEKFKAFKPLQDFLNRAIDA
ncbi:MAG: DUF2461 domain-containing protein [Bacteroidota bacterium]